MAEDTDADTELGPRQYVGRLRTNFPEESESGSSIS